MGFHTKTAFEEQMPNISQPHKRCDTVKETSSERLAVEVSFKVSEDDEPPSCSGGCKRPELQGVQ